MPGAGRVGDSAQNPRDSHNCPACPHEASGPGTEGSPNVLINNRAALRVGDHGVHSSCCGPNTWEATRGAPGVFINGERAHRIDDTVRHCGGNGKLVGGSDNVLIGDHHDPFQKVPTSRYARRICVVFDDGGEPVKNRSCRIIREDGRVIQCRTDDHGYTPKVFADGVEVLCIEVLDED